MVAALARRPTQATVSARALRGMVSLATVEMDATHEFFAGKRSRSVLHVEA
jgi:hypothetical protein